MTITSDSNNQVPCLDEVLMSERTPAQKGNLSLSQRANVRRWRFHKQSQSPAVSQALWFRAVVGLQLHIMQAESVKVTLP